MHSYREVIREIQAALGKSDGWGTRVINGSMPSIYRMLGELSLYSPTLTIHKRRELRTKLLLSAPPEKIDCIARVLVVHHQPVFGEYDVILYSPIERAFHAATNGSPVALTGLPPEVITQLTILRLNVRQEDIDGRLF